MALSPLVTAPVAWQSSLVDVQATSRWGLAWDLALVSSTFFLRADDERELGFALPAAHEVDAPPQLALTADERALPLQQVDPAEAAAVAAPIATSAPAHVS